MLPHNIPRSPVTHTTIVGVDLAKKVIQVCVVKHKQVHSNIEMTPDDFSLWLSTQRPVTDVPAGWLAGAGT